MLTNIFQTIAMVSQYFNSNKTKPRWLLASAAATQRFLPETSQTHSPSRKQAANDAGLGCPPKTGRRQGWQSRTQQAFKGEHPNCDKGNTEPVCTLVSQAEVAPHRLSDPMRKLQGREGTDKFCFGVSWAQVPHDLRHGTASWVCSPLGHPDPSPLHGMRVDARTCQTDGCPQQWS